MARKEEAEKLLRNGMSPGQIAAEMGISVNSVMQYLHLRVGEGALRLSDIYLAFPAQTRITLFKSIQHRRIFAGDMYEYISDIEITAHKMVRRTLESTFGDQETGWWRHGISEEIRQKCQSRREADVQPCESPFAYTDLIELSKIISKNWELFKNSLPQHYDAKRKLEADFSRLNMLRNAVMHPVKERDWSEDDFKFVKDVRKRFLEEKAT